MFVDSCGQNNVFTLVMVSKVGIVNNTRVDHNEVEMIAVFIYDLLSSMKLCYLLALQSLKTQLCWFSD